MSHAAANSAGFQLPRGFSDVLAIDNAAERFAEALSVAEKSIAAGVDIESAPDHAAIFTDPPQLVAGPLKRIGYRLGWDTRCYPSPVDGFDYINVSARLDPASVAYREGWFRYVAVVHPVDEAASEQMLSQGYGNPFLHHLTLGIVAPPRGCADEFEYAGQVVRFMADARGRMADVIGDDPGTLIAALPVDVVSDPRFAEESGNWVAGLSAEEFQFQVMQGGGILVQYFVLTGGRIEVALRSGTTQTFNPLSVDKISRDEISTIQDDRTVDADTVM
tara:strand:+ start:118 stop:945 length:828 start_codon:yes stop_codon:yes gene_type:complete